MSAPDWALLVGCITGIASVVLGLVTLVRDIARDRDQS